MYLYTPGSGLTHWFHAGQQTVVWPTLSFGWSWMTAAVGYQHIIPL